ncbi:hypothetical protein [Leeuwenhoekiella sp. MAR_2009_132]|uniref:hypothetical protein n=1 Tax=Leeuwenhoekiella sp. MAR_2009_132 TaxID=1392489 RepID=UPI00048B577F|nr:hypothetical protein [Leeuwenhoekiella sp. MAR_2009_132]
MSSTINENTTNRWVYGLKKLIEIRNLAIDSFNTNLFNNDPIIDPEAEKLLENTADRKRIFAAIDKMKNSDLKALEIELSNEETITLSID